MKRFAILGVLLLCVSLVSTSVMASNTAFKLNYELKSGSRNLISVPYFYFPSADTSRLGMETACEMCPDFATRGCDVTNIVRFIKSGIELSPLTFACISPCVVAFPLTPGEAYFVTVRADCIADIVGSHDDDYSVGGTKSLTLTQGNNNVSVPYHIVADTACDLCDHLATDNPGEVLRAVVKIDPLSGAPTSYACISPCVVAFDMEPGKGYFLVPEGDPVSWDIQWRTY